MRAGDIISVTDWEIIEYAAYKEDLYGNEANDSAETSKNIFDGDRSDETQPPELTRIATGLFDS